MKKINIKTKTEGKENVKVRLIKAPLVDTAVLMSVVSERARALVISRA